MASLGQSGARHSMYEDTKAVGMISHTQHSRASEYEMVRGHVQDIVVQETAETADYSVLNWQPHQKMKQTSHTLTPAMRAHSDDCLGVSPGTLCQTPVEYEDILDRRPHRMSTDSLLDSVRPTKQPLSVAVVGDRGNPDPYSVLSWNHTKDITPYSVLQYTYGGHMATVSSSLHPEICSDSTVISHPSAHLPGIGGSHITPVEDGGTSFSPDCGDEASKN